jgi:hypothetical protein
MSQPSRGPPRRVASPTANPLIVTFRGAVAVISSCAWSALSRVLNQFYVHLHSSLSVTVHVETRAWSDVELTKNWPTPSPVLWSNWPAFGPVGDWLAHTQDDVGEELVGGRSHVQCRVGRQVDLSSGRPAKCRAAARLNTAAWSRRPLKVGHCDLQRRCLEV